MLSWRSLLERCWLFWQYTAWVGTAHAEVLKIGQLKKAICIKIVLNRIANWMPTWYLMTTTDDIYLRFRQKKGRELSSASREACSATVINCRQREFTTECWCVLRFFSYNFSYLPSTVNGISQMWIEWCGVDAVVVVALAVAVAGNSLSSNNHLYVSRCFGKVNLRLLLNENMHYCYWLCATICGKRFMANRFHYPVCS